MEVLKINLLSKKLWVAVLTIALLMLNGDMNQAVVVALAYLGVQGAVDFSK